MEFFYGLLGFLQNHVDGLYHRVRRKAAVLDAEIHAAAGGVEADSQRVRRRKLGIQKACAPALGEDIVVIETGGAAVL